MYLRVTSGATEQCKALLVKQVVGAILILIYILVQFRALVPNLLFCFYKPFNEITSYNNIRKEVRDRGARGAGAAAAPATVKWG